jgi:hypothetical protein
MDEEQKKLSESVCERLKGINLRKQRPATLVQGDQVLATGAAIIEADRAYGVFWPSDQRPLNVQDRSIVLRMLGNAGAIQVKNFQRCDVSIWAHYHFDL